MSNAIEKRSWDDFRAIGLMWWVNRALHLFGWTIIVELDDESGEVVDCYPARCRFLGFCRQDEEDGFQKLSEYLKESAKHLAEEAKP